MRLCFPSLGPFSVPKPIPPVYYTHFTQRVTVQFRPLSGKQGVYEATGLREISYRNSSRRELELPLLDVAMQSNTVYDWYHRNSAIDFRFGLKGLPNKSLLEGLGLTCELQHGIDVPSSGAWLDPVGALGDAWTLNTDYGFNNQVIDNQLTKRAHAEQLFLTDMLDMKGNPVKLYAVGHGTVEYGSLPIRLQADEFWARISMNDWAKVATQTSVDAYTVTLAVSLTFALRGKLTLDNIALYDGDWVHLMGS